jgi:hypothetical protein
MLVVGVLPSVEEWSWSVAGEDGQGALLVLRLCPQLNALNVSVHPGELEEVRIGSSPMKSLMQTLRILIDQWVSQRVPPGPAKASKYVGVFVGVKFLGISR